MKKAALGFCLLACSLSIWAGGKQEGSADRGKYVAESGQIIPPAEIQVDSYITKIDFDYENPEGDVGVTLRVGHRRLSVHGQDEILQIGIQGRRNAFEDLPPLNLAFVVDASGSMSMKDKADWAREGFRLLVRRLRDQDCLSVIVFSDTARVLLPASRMADVDREKLVEKMVSVLPEGRAVMKTGLEAGREQIGRFLSPQRVNRILFLSDGLGDASGALETASRCLGEGVSVTTIGVGLVFNLPFMTDLATQGGGSSRFLSGREKIVDVFDTGLGRTVVPVAYDLSMRLECREGVKVLDTWGYDRSIQDNRASYSLPALHNGDYETIVALIRIPPGIPRGRGELARFDLTYRDSAGKQQRKGPYILSVDFEETDLASSGISDPMVLMAGTILHLALGLKDIGTLYASLADDIADSGNLTQSAWLNREVSRQSPAVEVAVREKAELDKIILAKRQRCLDVSLSLKKEVQNAHTRLGREPFRDELGILESYIRKLGRELGYGDAVVNAHLADREILPPEGDMPLRNRLVSLTRELAEGLGDGAPGTVLYAGFHGADGEESGLQRLADLVSRSVLEQAGFRLVMERDFTDYRARKGLKPGDFTDTDALLLAAADLRADYAVSGSCIEFSQTVVLFGRMLVRSGGSVGSLAQLILPKDDQVRALLVGAKAGQ